MGTEACKVPPRACAYPGRGCAGCPAHGMQLWVKPCLSAGFVLAALQLHPLRWMVTTCSLLPFSLHS